jgi:hypothetical protein
VCRGCGAYTQPRNGKGDAYAYCNACHPGAIQRRWTRELVLEAMVEWQRRFGWLPTSYDWSATHARRRAGQALKRLGVRRWPSASVVGPLFGTWPAARSLASAAATRRPLEPGECAGSERRSGIHATALSDMTRHASSAAG